MVGGSRQGLRILTFWIGAHLGTAQAYTQNFKTLYLWQLSAFELT